MVAERPLDEICINTLRFLSVDAVQKANSGHPGLPLGASPLAYVLWTRFLKHNPRNPQWMDRDRFVLSAGHGSMLLYSLLHLTGYELSLGDIECFRQWGSKTPGHPESGVTPGVEVTTGPLGQGFANAVGFAIAEAHLAAVYNRPGHTIVDHYSYAIVSDGDLMEGVASEAASLAGHLKLGKLICFYDDNRVTLSASTGLAFTEDRAARFEAYGWLVQSIADGNDIAAIERAIIVSRSQHRRPSLILVHTHLGFGSPGKQDSFEAHGSPLGAEEVRRTKNALDWPTDLPFHIPPAALAHFRKAVELGSQAEAEWRGKVEQYSSSFPDLAAHFQNAVAGSVSIGTDHDLPQFPPDPKGLSTRVAAGHVINAIAGRVPQLIGGSADLNPSTFTALNGFGDFQSPDSDAPDRQGSSGGDWGYSGRNIYFGVREHAMAATLNGLAAHGGTVPFGATFLVFSDYMRPPMRLAAMMHLRVIYVFTHDSIALGQDGPTHQPVEQLANLRAVPGLTVVRPADANETTVAWRMAFELPNRPCALILSRQNVPTLDRTIFAPAKGLRRGGYILADTLGKTPDVILIASGAEVDLIVAAGRKLGPNIAVRLVSMPCWDLFDAQDEEYRKQVLLPSCLVRLAVEAGAAQGWHRYVGDHGEVISLDGYGASAPGDVLMREFGFTPDNVCQRVLALLERHTHKTSEH